MLYTQYYIIIAKVLNENLSRQNFNYKMVMDYSYYIHYNYIKKSNLEKFVRFLKIWGFVEYRQGGKYPFSLKFQIPITLVDEICRNRYYTDEQRIELIKQHSVVLTRKDKILKLKERLK